MNYTYDTIGRLTKRTLTGAAAYATTYQYLAPDNTDGITTTPLVKSLTQSGQNFSYTYDNVGNIASVTRNGQTTTYVYDKLGQLTRVNDPHANKSTVYVYDRGGNITSYSEYAYTTGTLGAATKTVSYTYGDANWKDKVTAIGGKAITYDAIGNPLTYDGWTFSWKAGRMLASMVKTGTNAQFSYDHNGLRVKKVVNGVTTSYILNGKNIVHLKQGGDDLHFFYDAWGNPTSQMGTMAVTLGRVNPFRYRGYVYDEETGLYYLRSRYYNPVWKRFVNADSFLGHMRTVNAHNIYAYCRNTPINTADDNGAWGININKINLKKKLNISAGPETKITNLEFINVIYKMVEDKWKYDKKGDDLGMRYKFVDCVSVYRYVMNWYYDKGSYNLFLPKKNGNALDNVTELAERGVYELKTIKPDYSNLVKGMALFVKGPEKYMHVAYYIGDGLAIESNVATEKYPAGVHVISVSDGNFTECGFLRGLEYLEWE